MSVSDPLIKELKGWTRKLVMHGKEITDENENLHHFCESLENCLQKGLICGSNSFVYPQEPSAWHWFEYMADKIYGPYSTYALVIEQAKVNEKVHTPTGRLRLFIRISLMRKCFDMPIRTAALLPMLFKDFYNVNSIFMDEILTEILISVLMQCNKLDFKLNLRNAAFLDTTWQLPRCVTLELVPCKNLGISVYFMKGKALVVNVDERSVAAEDNKVEIGDILDEINENIITGDSKGQLRKIMKKASGKPIILHIIKYRIKNRIKKSYELYEPIMHLIKSSGIENIQFLLQTPPSNKGEITEEYQLSKLENKSLSNGISVIYCGYVHIGKEGDVKQIERAIQSLLKSEDVKQVPVKFECLEIGIKITQVIDNQIICNKTYMEISSCGRTINIPNYFAFIAGETNCNVATKFDAYIFYHKNNAEVQRILQSLGQGFQRTHFAV